MDSHWSTQQHSSLVKPTLSFPVVLTTHYLYTTQVGLEGAEDAAIHGRARLPSPAALCHQVPGQGEVTLFT